MKKLKLSTEYFDADSISTLNDLLAFLEQRSGQSAEGKYLSCLYLDSIFPKKTDSQHNDTLTLGFKYFVCF